MEVVKLQSSLPS